MNGNKKRIYALIRAKRYGKELPIDNLPSVDTDKMNEILDIILSLESGIKRRYHIRRLERLFFPKGTKIPVKSKRSKRKQKGRSAESIALFGK